MRSSNTIRNLMSALLVALVVLLAPRAAGADEVLTVVTGRVIDRVDCKADAGQSYALYVPSSYSPEKRWPVLYCFDPMARGRAPVEQFREAAEKYGYIVAGSNNSRNGPNQNPVGAFMAMWKDTHARFVIDDKRVYTTGFSGGARVATRVAILCKGCVAGVIACGAGFPPDMQPGQASMETRFVYYAALGIDDYNFPELKQLDETLDSLAIPHLVKTFNGAHQWPPAAACTEAIEWMEVQAIKSNRRGKDETLIAALFDKRMARAEAYERAGSPYDAFLDYSAIAAEFGTLKDTTAAQREAARLKESKEVARAVKDEKEQLKKQREFAAQIKNAGIRYFEASSQKDLQGRTIALGEIRMIVAGLQKRADAAQDSGERRIARRALRQMLAELFESAEFLYYNQPELAVVNLEVASEVSPNNPSPLYALARAYSRKGEKKQAIDALRRAIEKGFKDAARIENEKDLDSLRQEAGYKKLLDNLKEVTSDK